MDLALHSPSGARPSRALKHRRIVAELPPYIAEVVKAVAEGVQTSREFANVRGISITNASERFRMARNPGWIVSVNGQYVPRQVIRYRLHPSRWPD